MSARRLLVVALAALVLAAPLRAQGFPSAQAGGQLTLMNELYGVSGIEARRPGVTWRLGGTTSVGLAGITSLGLDLTLSNEGVDFRQRMSQIGFHPQFRWGTVHVGDFTQDLSAYTTSGLRITGAGADVRLSKWQFSVQGGRSQAQVVDAPDGATFRRTLFAGSVGYGAEGKSQVLLRLVSARDRPSDELPATPDTIGIDTLPTDLRPQAVTTPQSNLVLDLAGQLALFGDRLRLKGEVGASLLTRDRLSPAINPDSVPAGGLVDGLGGELTLSSSGDVAWNGEVEWRGSGAGLRGGIERIGAGYTSLGVAYLINDRQRWFAQGNVRLFRDRVALQARVQQQRDNLEGQRRFTTDRDAWSVGATWRVVKQATLVVNGLLSTAVNDAASDTLKVDNRALVLSSTLSVPWRLAGRDANVALSYAYQENEDRNVVRAIPAITVHNFNVAVAVPAGPLTVTPSVNGVLSDGGGVESQENVMGGLRVAARLGRGASASAQFSRSFVAAREVTGGLLQARAPLPLDAELAVSGRVMRYGALGTRPAFREAFLTTSVSRSF